jgi:hypothetical protein
MNTQKTVREHLKTLPLQIRLKAMENLRKQTYKGGFHSQLNYKSINLYAALSSSFVFSETREGHKFWIEISVNYRREQ